MMTQQMKIAFIGVMVLAFAADHCVADQQKAFTGTGQGGVTAGNIQDFDGSTTGTGIDNITLVRSFTIVDGDFVNRGAVKNILFGFNGLQHSFAGDLKAEVRHSQNGTLRSSVLFDRIGSNAITPDGDDSDFGNATYRFEDGGSSIWAEAANKGSGQSLASNGDGNGIDSYSASVGQTGATFNLLDVFATDRSPANLNGLWEIRLTDFNQNSVTGSITSVEMIVTTAESVPEPTIPSLLAIVGFGLLRRRSA